MTPTRIAIVVAGLMGAAGVALAAVSAHGGDASRLGPASNMLLFHVPATLAVLALIERRVTHPLIGGIAATGLLLGTALFSGDLTVRHFFDQPLFPMAAPIGGTLLIASWLVLAIAALVPRRA